MKNLFFLLLIGSSLDLQAQTTPLYIADTVDMTAPIPVSGSESPFDAPYNLVQDIYYHSDFPGMPTQGQITDVYIKMSTATPVGSKIYGLTIKMKPTAMNGFPQSWSVNDQIATGLTTVYYDSLFILNDSLAVDDWLRLILPVPYSYSFISTGDSNRNLMVQLSQDSLIYIPPFSGPTHKFNTYVYNYSSNVSPNRELHSNIDPSYAGVSVNNYLDVIGFNPKPDPPLALGEVNAKEKVKVYPNPARDKLYIENAAIKSYAITDIRGKILISGKLQEKYIDVSMLSTGLYLLRIRHETVKFLKE